MDHGEQKVQMLKWDIRGFRSISIKYIGPLQWSIGGDTGMLNCLGEVLATGV